ncbi:MAG: hypothetical protein HQL45_15760 [Alphaproteobacteria bacterium]|nr:hypothetical protein [Alphaproteobacteria bacterium]
MTQLQPYQERLKKHLSPEARAAIMRQWAIERHIRPALWRGGFIGHLPNADFQDYLQNGTALCRVRVEGMRPAAVVKLVKAEVMIGRNAGLPITVLDHGGAP